MNRDTFIRFSKFFIVGIVGFLVDCAVVTLFMNVFGFYFYVARFISFLCAASATYMGNRLFTFADRKGHVGKQWLGFLLVSSGGFILNYGTSILMVNFVPLAHAYPVLAVAAGSIAGMFFNFSGASKLVFPKA